MKQNKKNVSHTEHSIVFGAEKDTTKDGEVFKISGGTFSINPSEYVADGYQAVEN